MIFKADEIKSINAFQKSGRFHPFTCGGDRTDEYHLDGEGVLVATEEGFICPYCVYKQDWCHSWMKDWSWKRHANDLGSFNESIKLDDTK